MEINTDVSATQFARFAESARSQGMSVSAYLRKLVKDHGKNAEDFRKVKSVNVKE